MCSDEKRYEDGNDKNNNKDNDKKGKEDNELGQQGEISPLSTMENEKRIFIIDDEKSLLSVLRTYFENCGIKAYTYEEPPDLETELKEKSPHAILLDIIFPHTSGIEIIRDIKAINPGIPVIMMTGYAEEKEKTESLRQGAYALLSKPFESYEQLFHIVNNATNHYIEMLKTVDLTVEIEKRYEAEKLNLVELDFLKSLQHMIGETEDTAFVLRNFFTLLKTFLSFDIFAALIQQEEEIDIQICPNIEANKDLVEFISRTLSERLPGMVTEKKETRVMMNGEKGPAISHGKVYNYITVDFSTAKEIYGYAGLYRVSPFEIHEQAIFNRFCSHIALALEKISLFKEIKALSMHDGLTGIYNHAFIVKALGEEIERARRYSSHLSIIMIDIDDFKSINDSFGHLSGDFVLHKVSTILKQGLRTIDTVGRYGGEEFLAILPETDGKRAHMVGERIRHDIEHETFLYGKDRMKLTISAGAAHYSLGMDSNKLIKRADDNLYKAKRDGKNRIYYDKG
jgi:diguanylate cyclase (GGDEF)-like protein